MSERGVAEGANFLRDEANPAGPRRSEKTKPSGRTPTLGPETRAFAEPCNVKLSGASNTLRRERIGTWGGGDISLRHLRPPSPPSPDARRLAVLRNEAKVRGRRWFVKTNPKRGEGGERVAAHGAAPRRHDWRSRKARNINLSNTWRPTLRTPCGEERLAKAGSNITCGGVVREGIIRGQTDKCFVFNAAREENILGRSVNAAAHGAAPPCFRRVRRWRGGGTHDCLRRRGWGCR